MVSAEQHFRIDYRIKSKRTVREKSFIMRSPLMQDDMAWHWAAIDAGFTQIPKRGLWGVKPVTRLEAMSYGISEVRWTQI